MLIKYYHFFLLILFVFIVNTKNEKAHLNNGIKLLSTTKEYATGDNIILTFSNVKSKNIQLYCTNSYGTTLLNSEIKDNYLQVNFPKHISNKIGVVNWTLLNGKNPLSGNFKIIAKKNSKKLETYLGPPSIEAGKKDFSMLVVIPTDDLDNPLKQNTPVTIQHQFLKKIEKTTVLTDNLIAYKNIYSSKKSGRILVSSKCLRLNSKEYSINVTPAIPTNFKIFASRNHEYADGNQITTFNTSIIKDKNNNIVSDGTFVTFFIKNKNETILKTSGTTINGIATAKMIHPDYEEKWIVKAYINGIAESDKITVNYKKAFDSFSVSFSKDNRTIKVGPIKSFMQQLIPDGLQVKLFIFKDKKLIDTLTKESFEGYVNFKLDENIYNKGVYNFEIKTADITQEFKNKKLW